MCGEDNFTDAYYKMEYFLKHNVEEPLFRETMVKALLEMGCERSNLLLISWDNRWASLDVKLLQPLCDQDDIAITNEGELLSLIERWNGNRDKSMDDVLTLVKCFRQTPTNLDTLILFLTNMGLIHVEGEQAGGKKR